MKLTEEQVQNWRKVLAEGYGVGPYAYVAPVAQIERIAAKFQAMADICAEAGGPEQCPN